MSLQDRFKALLCKGWMYPVRECSICGFNLYYFSEKIHGDHMLLFDSSCNCGLRQSQPTARLWSELDVFFDPEKNSRLEDIEKWIIDHEPIR